VIVARPVGEPDELGWRTLRVESEIGTLSLTINGSGDYIESVSLESASEALWSAIKEYATETTA